MRDRILGPLVALAMLFAGCHGLSEVPADGVREGEDAGATSDGPGGFGPEPEWAGDAETGIRCRLDEPTAPVQSGESVALVVTYQLLNPARFDAVELELGAGLELVSGALRHDVSQDENVTVEIQTKARDPGDRWVHAYVWWNEDLGGEQASCHAWDLDPEQG